MTIGDWPDPLHPETHKRYWELMNMYPTQGFRLREAVRAIYSAAHWSPDRFVPNEVSLWEELRDAAGIEPGHAPMKLSGLPPMQLQQQPFHPVQQAGEFDPYAGTGQAQR